MSDLGEEIVKQYIARVQGDKKLREIARTIRNGGGYADAEQYAVRAGEVLSEVFHDNITADNFPVGSVNDIYQLIAPSIKMNYEANSQAVALVQKHLNTEGGIGMNPIPTQYDDNATMNIVGRMAKYESYEDAEFMLDQPMVTNSLGTVDKALHENADFQYKSGLKPKIVRTCEADACEWCQDLEGEYDYDEVKDHNNPVFQRHNNCACEITYEPGDGRVQDVDSRQWLDEDATKERLTYAKREELRLSAQDKVNRQGRMDRAMSGDNIGVALRQKTPGQKVIELSIKEQAKDKGKHNLIAEAIVNNHKDLKYISPERMYNLLREAGFNPVPLKESGHGFNDQLFSEGGGYIAQLGTDGGNIEYHPMGGRHGIDYYRITSGRTRKHWYDTDGKEFIIISGWKIKYIDV